MDTSRFAISESKDMKASDFKGKRLKVTIERVEFREYPAKDGKPAQTKPVLFFAGKEKGLVVNPTNAKALNTAYGADDELWVGHEIGLSTVDYDNFPTGWEIEALDVEKPDFDDDIPF